MKRNEIILETGISFGSTSGVITTRGLMVGLHSRAHSRAIVIGGILPVAIADALGIHVIEESKNSSTPRQIWKATLATFAAKFVIEATFVIPVMAGPLDHDRRNLWADLADGPQFLSNTGTSDLFMESDRRTPGHHPVPGGDHACGR
ncbi:MAG: hypothetical protein OEV53_15100 [Nitrospira sp.]|nr:hypothetical protein [Nitrospira sp.]